MTLWVQEALYARDELPSAFTRCTRLDSQGCAVLYAFMITQHATVSAVDQTMMCKIKYIGSPLNSVCSLRFNVLLSLLLSQMYTSSIDEFDYRISNRV